MKTQNKTVKYCYAKYKETVSNPVPYNLFRLVLERYFLSISELIIDGGVLKMPFNLGEIKILKVERKTKVEAGRIVNPSINWGETNKLRKQGIDKLVLFNDEYYLKWYWAKGNNKCKVKNHTVYSFKPTSNNPHAKDKNGNSYTKLGNRGKLVQANKDNPLLHLEYEFRKSNTYKKEHKN
jgi:hypothetical protein